MNSGKSRSHDDENLIRLFIAGDRPAFDDLYRCYAPKIIVFLAARVRSPEVAEDLSQTVWSRIWERRESFNGDHFRGWLFAIARNAIIDAGRKSTRQRATQGIDNVAEPRDECDPSERISREEELKALRDCIKLVGGVFVESVVRTQLNHESPEQLAQAIGKARATVDTRVSRGKLLLRECLENKLR